MPLIQFADDVETVVSLDVKRIEGEDKEADSSLRHLLETHPELTSIKLDHSSCTDKGLEILLAHPVMERIELKVSNITGKNLRHNFTFSPSLKNLSLYGVS